MHILEVKELQLAIQGAQGLKAHLLHILAAQGHKDLQTVTPVAQHRKVQAIQKTIHNNLDTLVNKIKDILAVKLQDQVRQEDTQDHKEQQVTRVPDRGAIKDILQADLLDPVSQRGLQDLAMETTNNRIENTSRLELDRKSF